MERRVKSSESDGRFRRVRIVTEAARTFRRLPQVARGCRSLNWKSEFGVFVHQQEAASGSSNTQHPASRNVINLCEHEKKELRETATVSKHSRCCVFR